MKHIRTIIIVFGLFAEASYGALHIDGAAGFSAQSPYRYFAETPSASGTPWLTFDPINNVYPSTRLSIDIGKSAYRFGVGGGFLRRYNLTMHERSGTTTRSYHLGEVVSIPVLGFIEAHRKNCFGEFGLGPFITRFNYKRDFDVTSFFGFLFGGGCTFPLTPGVHLLVKGELLLNAPVFVVEYLKGSVKTMIHDSRFTEYNSNEFQTIIYNAAISASVQYEFGKNIRIPAITLPKQASSRKGYKQ